MTDKHMDEVIKMYEKMWNERKSYLSNFEQVRSFIPKACRSYARKVLEDIDNDVPAIEKRGPLWHRFAMELNRFTKEPRG